jgi:restriction endonuclease S subunit
LGNLYVGREKHIAMLTPLDRKTVNLGEIRKFKVIAPSINEQKRFASRVEAARSIQSQQSAAAKAQATFDALPVQIFSNNKER